MSGRLIQQAVQGVAGRVSRKTNVGCWVSLTSFVSILLQKKIKICGGLDSDCTEVTLHRVANFRVRHPNSVNKHAQRGTKLLVLLFIQPILILLYRFLVKNPVNGPFLGQISDVLIPPQIAIFEMSTFFETEKSAKIVSYIKTVLLQLVEPVNFSLEVVGTNWIPKTNFLDF